MAYVNLAGAWASPGQLDRAVGAYLAALALSRYRPPEVREYLEAGLAKVRAEIEEPGPTENHAGP